MAEPSTTHVVHVVVSRQLKKMFAPAQHQLTATLYVLHIINVLACVRTYVLILMVPTTQVIAQRQQQPDVWFTHHAPSKCVVARQLCHCCVFLYTFDVGC
jgi:hypothetical protein